jgi:hypothetical protein
MYQINAINEDNTKETNAITTTLVKLDPSRLFVKLEKSNI